MLLRTFIILAMIASIRMTSFATDRMFPVPLWYEDEEELALEGFDTSAEGLTALIESFAADDFREKAITILGLRSEHSAEDTLERVLAFEGSTQVRQEAALALARLGNSEGIFELQRICLSEDNRRRFYYAAILADLGDQTCISTVLDGRSSTRLTAYMSAVRAIPSFYSMATQRERRELLTFLEEALRHERDFIRSVALDSSYSVSKTDSSLIHRMLVGYSIEETEEKLKKRVQQILGWIDPEQELDAEHKE